MPNNWEAKVDKDAVVRAETIVKEALRALMQGTSISPQEHDCPRERADMAVRDIVHVLWQQSEAYELPTDLRAALWDIANGSEPELREDRIE